MAPATNPRPQPEPDLAELFARLASGDQGALGLVYDHCADEMYGLALWRCGSRTDAADSLQDAFVRLAQAARRGRLGAVRDPRAYLLGIVRRTAVDSLRWRRLEPLQEIDAVLLVAETPDPGTTVDAERASAKLRELPLAQREAVYLRCYAGLTFEAIGRLCRVPTFTAASRFRLGIEKLRALLGVRA